MPRRPVVRPFADVVDAAGSIGDTLAADAVDAEILATYILVYRLLAMNRFLPI